MSMIVSDDDIHSWSDLWVPEPPLVQAERDFVDRLEAKGVDIELRLDFLTVAGAEVCLKKLCKQMARVATLDIRVDMDILGPAHISPVKVGLHTVLNSTASALTTLTLIGLHGKIETLPNHAGLLSVTLASDNIRAEMSWTCPSAQDVTILCTSKHAWPADFFLRFPSVQNLEVSLQPGVAAPKVSGGSFHPPPPMPLKTLILPSAEDFIHFIRAFPFGGHDIRTIEWFGDSDDMQEMSVYELMSHLHGALKYHELHHPGGLTSFRFQSFSSGNVRQFNLTYAPGEERVPMMDKYIENAAQITIQLDSARTLECLRLAHYRCQKLTLLQHWQFADVPYPTLEPSLRAKFFVQLAEINVIWLPMERDQQVVMDARQLYGFLTALLPPPMEGQDRQLVRLVGYTEVINTEALEPRFNFELQSGRNGRPYLPSLRMLFMSPIEGGMGRIDLRPDMVDAWSDQEIMDDPRCKPLRIAFHNERREYVTKFQLPRAELPSL